MPSSLYLVVCKVLLYYIELPDNIICIHLRSIIKNPPTAGHVSQSWNSWQIWLWQKRRLQSLLPSELLVVTYVQSVVFSSTSLLPLPSANQTLPDSLSLLTSFLSINHFIA